LARQAEKDLVAGFYLLPDGLLGEGRQAEVVVGVVAELVPLGHHVPDKVGVGLGVTADDEKSGLEAQALKGVQKEGGEEGVGGVVKGEGGVGPPGIAVVDGPAPVTQPARPELLSLLLGPVGLRPLEAGPVLQDRLGQALGNKARLQPKPVVAGRLLEG
jgi:hypothetical protein